MGGQTPVRATNVTSADAARHLAGRFFLCLIFVDVLLALAYYLTSFAFDVHPKYRVMFDFDSEGNVPTWFSSIQYFMVGTAFVMMCCCWKRERNISRSFFTVVAIGAIFLSLDETGQLHESISAVYSDSTWLPHFKHGHGKWIAVYGVVGLFILVWIRKDIATIFRHHRQSFQIAAVGVGLILAGAVGLEIVSYQFLRYDSSMEQYYKFEVIFEEFFELVGASTLVFASVRLAAHYVLSGTPAPPNAGD